VVHSKEILAKEHFDYLIFGHRHLPLDVSINNSRYINLGDWVKYFTYAVFDGQDLKLLKFEA
jgi:UDP-2,3-diacylglucosamine hydrolase